MPHIKFMTVQDLLFLLESCCPWTNPFNTSASHISESKFLNTYLFAFHLFTGKAQLKRRRKREDEKMGEKVKERSAFCYFTYPNGCSSWGQVRTRSLWIHWVSYAGIFFYIPYSLNVLPSYPINWLVPYTFLIKCV